MPVNWKKIPQTAEYQKLRLDEREDFLNRLYDQEFGGNLELKSLSPEDQRSIRRKALQTVDPNIYGLRRFGGAFLEGVSGLGANVIEGLGGAANFALQATGTPVKIPQGVQEKYKELTEVRSEPEKWGAAVGEMTQLALPFGAEAKAAKWTSRLGRFATTKAATKVLGEGAVGRTAGAIGRFGADVAGQVAAQGSTLTAYGMLHGKDAEDAFNYAKTAAYYSPPGLGILPGFATWGPIANRIFSAKWLPKRVWDYETKVSRMQWGKQGLGDALRLSVPAWLIRGAINAPGPRGFLGKNPERAVIEEGIHAATLGGYLSKVNKRVDAYVEESKNLLQIAKNYGGDADMTRVMDKLKDVLVNKANYSFADPGQKRVMTELMDRITSKLMPPRAGGRLFIDVLEAQELKSGFGREINWYRGVSSDIWDAERQVYHLLDEGIDNAVEIARGNIRKAVYGQWPYAQATVDLKQKLEFLKPAGRLSILNDKIASLISAEKGLRNVISGTFSDHAKFWGIRLGPWGVLGASIGLASAAPGFGAAVGYGLLGTPMGRQALTLGYTGLSKLGEGVAKGRGFSLAKTRVGPTGRMTPFGPLRQKFAHLTLGGLGARGFAAFDDPAQFGGNPYDIMGSPDTPLNDPLGLRRSIMEQQNGQPDLGGQSQETIP